MPNQEAKLYAELQVANRTIGRLTALLAEARSSLSDPGCVLGRRITEVLQELDPSCDRPAGVRIGGMYVAPRKP